MLLGNYSNLNSNPGQNIGGFTNPCEWKKVSSAMCFYAGDHAVIGVTDRANLYTGTRAPYVLVLAPKAGELGATGSVFGISSINVANLAGGINIAATLSGDGTLTATGSLLAFATATLSGIGDLTADITGKIEMAASLSGQGDIIGALGALSGAVCAIISTGALSGDITGKLEASASLSGSGDLTAAILAVMQIQAALAGIGGVSSDILGAGGVDSSISGSGALTGSISTIAHIQSLLAGIGSLTLTSGAVPGDMYAAITLSTELSPENLAAAVWNALAASVNNAGTMGEKLNDAGSASNPWTEVVDGSYTAAELLRLLVSAAAGKTYIVNNPDGSKTIKFRDLDDTKDRIGANVDEGQRTNIILDLT